MEEQRSNLSRSELTKQGFRPKQFGYRAHTLSFNLVAVIVVHSSQDCCGCP